MQMQLKSVERFIYFIVKESRNWNWQLRDMHPITKLKHYLYMSDYVNVKYNFNLTKQDIYGQTMTAMDSEWSHVFKTHYINNCWDYYFESSVTLDTDNTHFETQLQNDKINVLNDYTVSDKTPTVSDVQDDMLEDFKDDYLDFQLNDTDDEGILQDALKVIKMPGDDSMVIHLNELCDEENGELILDTLSEEDAIDSVSNEAIACAMESDFKDMLRLLDTDIGFSSDSDVKKQVIEFYINMLENLDLFTWLTVTMKGSKNE